MFVLPWENHCVHESISSPLATTNSPHHCTNAQRTLVLLSTEQRTREEDGQVCNLLTWTGFTAIKVVLLDLVGVPSHARHEICYLGLGDCLFT